MLSTLRLLTDVIEERVAFWRPVLDGQDQQLHYRSDHPGLAVQLARHDVEQLLDVALENALRYAGAGTTVTVSTEQTGETVELVVSDNGSGLPDEDLSRAAARFWRGQGDRRRNRPRVGDSRRDRRGSWRGDRGGEGPRRRPPGPLPPASGE